ncbi:hypothetical protein MF672_015500 [Actinomadura sp. ATCC 31491]|uniref:DUF2207 domain-containing protein n=1 Tax=Actinomadura luzonensis TaxID=2805427 RepID=A0ABT0FS76_9ACTN|nr:hypothetical protein [Actinomadura luzonensis]MCK2215181.1 hypothetical protein [Actinomadura luzonensis]
MDLVWPAAAWALWAAILAVALGVAGRERPAGSPAPAGPGRPVPQAVAELLRGMRAQEVFHTTLFELAELGRARVDGDLLSLTDGPGPSLTDGPGPSPADGPGEPPAAYQRWALDRVRERMAGAGELRVVALMPDGAALEGDFLPLVQRHAIDLGLARRRWPSMIVPVVLAVALVVPWFATVARAGVSWLGGIATMVSFVAGGSLLLGGRGFLLTASGREVAETVPPASGHEWIFTGSGWRGAAVEPAGPAAGAPRRREVIGHVVKRWYDAERRARFIALHDGRSEWAEAFAVEPGIYKDVLPGDCVRLLVRRDGEVVRVLTHERHW